MPSNRGSSGLPDERDVLGTQRVIARDQRAALDGGLTDEHAVEGIAVVRWEVLHSGGVRDAHRERLDARIKQQRKV
jgi:hypothetical protein